MSIKFCSQCGNQIQPESSFCSACGNKISNKFDSISESTAAVDSSKDEEIFSQTSSTQKKFNWNDMSPGSRLSIVLAILAAIYFSFFQSGNSSIDTSAMPSNEISGLVMSEVPGEYTRFSCSDTQLTSAITCILAIKVSNNGNSAVHLYGDIYALVDGKVFKASTIYGGIDYVSTDINPGESQSTTISFDVPNNSTISDIFIGDSASDGLSGAKVSLKLNKSARV